VTLLFNQFAFVQANSGGTGGASNQINFNPLADANGLGFDIVPTSAFNAGATHVNDVQINFVASVVGGASLIDDLYLSMTGTTGASGVGGGSAGTDILSEQFCRGGTVPPGSCPGGALTDTLTITGASSGVTVSDTKTFALTSSLSVLKDIQLTGNNGTVPSAVTDVKNQISIQNTVPEPTTVFLLGGGLIALGLVKSRARRQR